MGYDYKTLFMPTVPWGKQERKLQMYKKDEALPIVLSLVMGLQHAFAMLGGLITPPYVVMKFTVAFMDNDLQQAAIASALIVSGLCTMLNCYQFKIGKFKLGTGMLSVIGTSFTMLPIFETSMRSMMADGDTGKEAYGRMLGTVMLCCFLEIGLSFLPQGVLRKMFPPVVSGVTVMLIGVGLTGTGMKYWGGGAVCADMAWKSHAHAADIAFRPPGNMCEFGEVRLPYGAPELVGLGFSVVIMLVIIELFGSPFMKNCNVVIAMLFGYFVAGVSRHCIDVPGIDEVTGEETMTEVCQRYVTSDKIDDADWITFLWVKTFDIGFYGPAVFPLLIAFIVTTVETIGDIQATYEASGEIPEGEEYEGSVQGGLLSDGICSFFSALCMSMPNTTFSQNNGVISLTKCASRRAGIACGAWLVFFGIIAKFSGIISSIPDCVIGGMTTFLFCNVFVSGLKVVSKANLESRRNRFILALSMGIGIGVSIVPYMFADMRGNAYNTPFWECTDCSNGTKGVRDGIIIFLSTPYCIGSVLALLLNLILPEDPIIIVAETADEPEKEGETGKV